MISERPLRISLAASMNQAALDFDGVWPGPSVCAAFRRSAIRPAVRTQFCYTTCMDTLLSRITIDPAVCHGKPCVRGLRYPVETLLELLSSGMTIEDILADYEDLERDDLLAALAFAARLAQTRRLQPVGR